MAWYKPWEKTAVVPPVRNVARRGFEAGKVDRLTASFMASSISIDRELRGQIDLMRRRSRDLFRNNEYAKKFGRMVRRNVVGPTGFTLQVQASDTPGKPDKAAILALESAFKRFGRKGICEISGRYSQADAERALITSAARDGEFLVRLIRGKAAGNEFNFAYQILDIERLDTTMNIAPTHSSNAVVMGVEMDPYRRPVAYWIFKSHPNGGLSGSRERERVPAADVLHDFLPDDEPESARGIPWMHAAMLRLNDLGAYRAAAIIASRAGASKMGIFTTPDGNPADIADGEDAGGDFEMDMEAGTFAVAPEGTNFIPFDPAYPHQQFDMFMKSCLRGIASGFGVAYNSFANDLEGVSFSSIRSGTLEERDEWTMMQNWFVEAFLMPLYEAWLEMGLLSGAIKMPSGAPLPAAKKEKFQMHNWQGRRWSWVDPLRDMQTNLLAIRNGLSSPQRVAASMGIDVEEVVEELKRFEEMLKDKGVSLNQSDSVASKPSLNDTQDDEQDDDALDDATEDGKADGKNEE